MFLSSSTNAIFDIACFLMLLNVFSFFQTLITPFTVESILSANRRYPNGLISAKICFGMAKLPHIPALLASIACALEDTRYFNRAIARRLAIWRSDGANCANASCSCGQIMLRGRYSTYARAHVVLGHSAFPKILRHAREVQRRDTCTLDGLTRTSASTIKDIKGTGQCLLQPDGTRVDRSRAGKRGEGPLGKGGAFLCHHRQIHRPVSKGQTRRQKRERKRHDLVGKQRRNVRSGL